MSRYREISTRSQLPVLGAVESDCLDFKAKHFLRNGDRRELAKDIAAFANHLGGTILVGGEERDHALNSWIPLTQTEAGEARRDYEEAVRDFCSPRPQLRCEPIPEGNGFVLAVNVPALPDRLVGVRGSRGSDCWSFPYRAATQTIFLMPEQLPLYADSRTRRALIILTSIPTDERVFVRTLEGAQLPGTALYGTIRRIAEHENAVTFAVEGTAEVTFALDTLTTVFKDQDQWTICFAALR